MATTSCGAGRSTSRARSGSRSGTSSRSCAHAADGRAGRRADARRAVVSRRDAELRRARAAPAGSRRGRRRRRRPIADAGAVDADRRGASRRGRALPRRPRPARRSPRRPRRRVPAQHSRSHRRAARHREPRRDLVVVRAGVRTPRGHRPVRADRAARAAHRRRLPLRRPRRRAAGGGRGDPGGAAVARGDGRAPLPGSRGCRERCRGRSLGRTCSPIAGALEFEAVPFDHPLYILYSSGTTGLPKPIVHGHGGITLEHLKALGLHTDLGPADRFCWFTTTGWMMWNYLVSGPAGRSDRRHVRRQSRPGRTWRACGDWQPRRDRPTSGPVPRT